jgi:Tol biopolymer transport system component
MKPRRWSVALAALLLGGTIASGSTAADANPHDRIMFTRSIALVTANPDGSDVRQVSPDDDSYRGSVDWSPDGRFAVYTKVAYYGTGPTDPEAWVLDVAKGTERQITNLEDQPWGFDWSPDGKQIAFSLPLEPTRLANGVLTVSANGSGVWVMDADGGNQRLITAGSSARWSPDGKRLVLVCDIPKAMKLCLVNADGSGRTEIPNTAGFQSPDWAPDGVTLVAAGAPAFGTETVVLSIDGVVEHRFPEWYSARWSRDGDLAFLRRPDFETVDQCLPDPCETYRGIFMAERDGTGLRRVTTNQYDFTPQFAR